MNKNFPNSIPKTMVACQIIAENFILRNDVLQTKRSSWTPEYAQDLKKRIDNAIDRYLGKDFAYLQRNLTESVKAIMATSNQAVNELKGLVMVEFEDEPVERDEILNTLGYKPYWSKSIRANQSGMLNLLKSISTNLTDELKTKLVEKEIAADFLDGFAPLYNQLSSENLEQEVQKGITRVMHTEARDELYALYAEVNKLAKRVRIYFHDPLIRDEFSFNKIVSKLG